MIMRCTWNLQWAFLQFPTFFCHTEAMEDEVHKEQLLNRLAILPNMDQVDWQDQFVHGIKLLFVEAETWTQILSCFFIFYLFALFIQLWWSYPVWGSLRSFHTFASGCVWQWPNDNDLDVALCLHILIWIPHSHQQCPLIWKKTSNFILHFNNTC